MLARCLHTLTRSLEVATPCRSRVSGRAAQPSTDVGGDAGGAQQPPGGGGSTGHGSARGRGSSRGRKVRAQGGWCQVCKCRGLLQQIRECTGQPTVMGQLAVSREVHAPESQLHALLSCSLPCLPSHLA